MKCPNCGSIYPPAPRWIVKRHGMYLTKDHVFRSDQRMACRFWCRDDARQVAQVLPTAVVARLRLRATPSRSGATEGGGG